jgi:hypothetical protein
MQVYGLYRLDQLLGYAVYSTKSRVIKIDCIYAPGHGKALMAKLEAKYKRQSMKKIILNVSIDPTERQEKVMKRINYYIGLKYRVYDITYRPKYGPLLHMEKVL